MGRDRGEKLMSQCYFCKKVCSEEESEIDFHSKVGEHFCRDCEDDVYKKYDLQVEKKDES